MKLEAQQSTRWSGTPSFSISIFAGMDYWKFLSTVNVFIASAKNYSMWRRDGRAITLNVFHNQYTARQLSQALAWSWLFPIGTCDPQRTLRYVLSDLLWVWQSLTDSLYQVGTTNSSFNSQMWSRGISLARQHPFFVWEVSVLVPLCCFVLTCSLCTTSHAASGMLGKIMQTRHASSLLIVQLKLRLVKSHDAFDTSKKMASS